MNKELTGIELIAKERERQIKEEGWTPEHDNKHIDQEIARAASCYAMPDGYRDMHETLDWKGREVRDNYPDMWPWEPEYWKPTPDNRIRELVKAGALIVAEIDRLLNTGEYSD